MLNVCVRERERERESERFLPATTSVDVLKSEALSTTSFSEDDDELLL